MRFLSPLLLILLVLSGCSAPEAPPQVPLLRAGASASFDLEGSLAGFGLGLGQGMQQDGKRIFPTRGVLLVEIRGPVERITGTGEIAPVYEMVYSFEQAGNAPFLLGKQYLQPGIGVIGRVVDGQVTQDGVVTPTWIHGWGYSGPDLLLAALAGGLAIDRSEIDVHNYETNRSTRLKGTVVDQHLVIQPWIDEGHGISGAWDSSCAFPSMFQNIGKDGSVVMKLERRGCEAGNGEALALSTQTPPRRNPLLQRIGSQSLWVDGSISVGGPSVQDAWDILTRSVPYSMHCSTPCSLVEIRGSVATKAGEIPLMPPSRTYQWGFIVSTGSNARSLLVEYAGQQTRVLDLGASPEVEVGEEGIPGAPLGATFKRFEDRGAFAVSLAALPTGAVSGAYVLIREGEWDQVEANGAQTSANLAWLAVKQGHLSSFPSTHHNL